jgi:hypothetical protein
LIRSAGATVGAASDPKQGNKLLGVRMPRFEKGKKGVVHYQTQSGFFDLSALENNLLSIF